MSDDKQVMVAFAIVAGLAAGFVVCAGIGAALDNFLPITETLNQISDFLERVGR